MHPNYYHHARTSQARCTASLSLQQQVLASGPVVSIEGPGGLSLKATCSALLASLQLVAPATVLHCEEGGTWLLFPQCSCGAGGILLAPLAFMVLPI